MVFNSHMMLMARELRALTQSELAVRSGISQPQISKFETGEATPTEEQLAALGSVLEFPPSFFQRPGSLYGGGVSFIHYRKRAKTTAGTIKRIEAEMNLRRLIINDVFQQVDIESPLGFESMDIQDYKSPEQVAQLVRAKWRMPAGPVPNLIGIIEAAGGIVFEFNFGTRDIDALNIWPDPLPPLFFVNSEAPPDRRRFSLAHEVGHAFMHQNRLTDTMEDEANRFAAEFLMPAADISRDLIGITVERAANLKPLWRVAMSALIKRAADLKIITQFQYRRLFTRMNAMGIRKNEPVKIQGEKARFAYQLVEAFRDTLDLSMEGAAEALCLRPEEFESRILERMPQTTLRIAR
jgi:Zn-dependent peptidase ImmA (M78 family)/transcriptional regulator with XRE-family HTH domain